MPSVFPYSLETATELAPRGFWCRAHAQVGVWGSSNKNTIFPIPSVFLYSFLFHINVMFSYLVRYRYSMWSREEEGRIRFGNSGDLRMGKRGARTDEEFTPPRTILNIYLVYSTQKY